MGLFAIAKASAKMVATKVIVPAAESVAIDVATNKMRQAIGADADKGEQLQKNMENINSSEGVVDECVLGADHEEVVISSTADEDVTADDEASDKADENDIDPSLYENIEVSGVVSVQDSMEYYQKNIALSATFSVNGKLAFKNCTITLASTASFNVVGSLRFQNCEIVSDLTRTEDNYVITSLNSNITFKNCIIKNGKYFIHAKSVDSHVVSIENCTFSNCSAFVAMNGGCKSNFSIKKSAIYIGESVIGEKTGLYSGQYIFDISHCEEFVANDVISTWFSPDPQQNRYKLFDIGADKVTVTNCEIRNADIWIHGCDPHMDKCTLYDCNCCVAYISNCKIDNSDIECTVIDQCDFENMQDKFVEAKTISNSTFDNIHNKELYFIRVTEGIDNCIFSNVDMEFGSHLIYVKLDYGLGDKKKDIVVSNCRFLNCYTERADKKLIVGKQVHHTLFTDKEKPYDVRCLNCMGLNGVKDGKFVEEPV